MKNFVISVLALFSILVVCPVFAEDASAPAASSSSSTSSEAVASEPAAPAAPASVVSTDESAVATPAAVAAPEMSVEKALEPAVPGSDNLEFISGEITSLDQAAKTITVKLYGESENASTGAEKILTVKVDENTDITDGEKDRDLKSLAANTEVDVEYDPATSKATYIFVY